MICLLCLPWLAIWTSPKAKLSTVDCLEADRLEFYYRIAAQVQRNCVSKQWRSYGWAWTGLAVPTQSLVVPTIGGAPLGLPCIQY